MAKEDLLVTPHGRRRIGRPQQSWKNQVTDFMRSRNLEEDMAKERHLWPLGVDRRLLVVYILIIIIIIIILSLFLYVDISMSG